MFEGYEIKSCDFKDLNFKFYNEIFLFFFW